MLIDVLNDIQQDLKYHTNSDKSKLLEKCISDRLNSSLQQYYKELNDSVSYLECRNPINLFKRLNRGL